MGGESEAGVTIAEANQRIRLVARIVAAREALEAGSTDEAHQVLRDLEEELVVLLQHPARDRDEVTTSRNLLPGLDDVDDADDADFDLSEVAA